METEKSFSFRAVVKLISTIISWTVFVLLLICAALLVYYFIATRIYAAKGSGYEPKFSLYTIISPSMVPNINVYDVIIDVKVDKPEDIKINDVITYNSSLPEVHGGTITHRVISISQDENGEYIYQTKGDNNLVEDRLTVPYRSVVGKVAFKIPKLGKLQFFVASKGGWLLVVLIPALYILVKDILKLLKLVKTDDSKKSKFVEFLNRPLLTFNKTKLLTYSDQNEVKESTNYTYTNEDPKVEQHVPFPNFEELDIEDDFEIEELPKLK